MIPLAADHWTAYTMPEKGRGVLSGKHVTTAWCPADGRTYWTGGDYSNPWGGSSYVQATWSLSLAERVAGDRNAGWRLVHPYCLPAGRTEQPKHPDTVGLVWTGTRFLMVPGQCVAASSGNCTGETASAASDPGYRFNEMMWFDRGAPGTWTAVTRQPVPGQDGSRFCVYDPPSDALYRWREAPGAGMCVERMRLSAPDVWKALKTNVKNAGGGSVRCKREYVAYDPDDRAMYSVDGAIAEVGATPRLMRYRIATNAVDDLGPIPGPAYPTSDVGEWSHTIWMRPHRRLFFLRIPGTVAAHTYDPATATWASAPTATDRPAWNGGKLYGLSLAYDEGEDAVLVHGGMSVANPYFFLWRWPATAPVTRPVIGQIERAS